MMSSDKPKDSPRMAPVSHDRGFVDIIWNLTTVCPWNCAVCCVDAVYTRAMRGEVIVVSKNLTLVERIPVDPTAPSIYDQAARLRQARGEELDLAGKMRVLDHLDGFAPRVDFSGGDPLVLSDTIGLIAEAAKRFGRTNITLTATGPGLSRSDPQHLGPLIGELNFTYNGEPDTEDPNSPPTYARSNLQQAALLARAGVATRAECPLTLQNLRREALEEIYIDLHEAGIDKLLVMRLFPVGRGEDRPHQVPSREQYLGAIDVLRELEARYGRPEVRLQCALRHLAGPFTEENPCDAIRESFGLMANGVLLGSPWAINKVGQPIDPVWVLGNLAEQRLSEILASERVRALRERLDENKGHCKIFSYIYGSSPDPRERLFEKSDPLYSASADRVGDSVGS